jgi:SAM-dependent methyltransferase
MATPTEHESNRHAWNEVTPAHNSHKGDQGAFFREGGTTLFPEEVELLGDVRGLALLHLQCNCGQDSLSLARLGAHVTGVDISDEAISFAQTLSADSGIEARFVRDDLFGFLEKTEERFDRILSTYGCLPWLKDLNPWANGIERLLKPQGRFVLVEFHPAALVFDEEWKATNPYSSKGHAITDVGIPDYVAQAGPTLVPWGFEEGVKDYRGRCPSFEFYWGLSDVFSVLVRAGLTLARFEEYPYTNGARIFSRMEEREGRRLYPPSDAPQMPLMYGAVLEKCTARFR